MNEVNACLIFDKYTRLALTSIDNKINHIQDTNSVDDGNSLRFAVANGEIRQDPLINMFPIVLPPNTPTKEDSLQLLGNVRVVKASWHPP